MNPMRRSTALAAILGVLAAGAILDRRERGATDVQTAGDVQVPMAARSSAGSSAWFCTGATAAPNGAADGTVVIANAGDRRLTGSVTVVPSEGEPRRVGLIIAPASATAVRLVDVVPAPNASAIVELDGGDVVVEQAVNGPLGESVAPCASSASSTWYFAEGATTKDATEVLSLFNPFPEDAVVDLVFSTEEGQVTPQALTGLTVRGGGMVTLNVGEHVQRREAVSAVVRARTGRVVAHRLQMFDGSAGRKGMSSALGAASPGDVWYFPEGRVGEGIGERYHVFNPSPEEARVGIDLTLEQGVAEPILVTVPPETRVTVVANDEARIPKNVFHAATLRTTNEVDVVVERSFDLGPPSPLLGLAITSGARLSARQWVLAAGAANAQTDEYIVLFNPAAGTAHVSVTLLGDGARLPVATLGDVQVGPGQRARIRLVDHLQRDRAPLVVESSEPIVVERDLYRAGAIGASMVIGIPLRPPGA